MKRKKQIEKCYKGRKFTNQDLWDLDVTLARDISKGLELFMKQNKWGGHPADITQEEWNNILKNMYWAMNEVSNDYPNDPINILYDNFFKTHDIKDWGMKVEISEEVKQQHEEYFKKVKKGLHLFAERLPELWW